jgi:hypothetical protein
MSGIISLFCETLTAIGCVVRLQTDFMQCEKCKKAIPSEKIYNIFKTKNTSIPIPKIWNSKCSNC